MSDTPSFDISSLTGLLGGSAAHELDAHKDLLGQVLRYLGNTQGIAPEQVAQDAGVPTPDVNALSHGDLVQMTLYLAQTHPEIVEMVAKQFPAAQPVLALLTGGAGSSGGQGGLLGGLLGRVLGG